MPRRERQTWRSIKYRVQSIEYRVQSTEYKAAKEGEADLEEYAVQSVTLNSGKVSSREERETVEGGRSRLNFTLYTHSVLLTTLYSVPCRRLCPRVWPGVL